MLRKPCLKGMSRNILTVPIIHTSFIALIISLDIKNINGIWRFWKDSTNGYSDLSIRNYYDERAFPKAIGENIDLIQLLDS